MRIFLVISLWLFVVAAPAQRLTGTWQVVKESNCLGIEMVEPEETEQELLESMSTLSGSTPKTFRFNDDGTGEENWRTRGKRKASSKEKFMYRFTEGAVYFLDKKTRLITDTFLVETFTASSLIMFNKDRTCERVELARVN
jgi:hypothetical protein